MSLEVVISSHEDERSTRGGITRSTSAASSTSARQHHSSQHQHQHHNLHSSTFSTPSSPSPGEAKKYQYVPYSNSASPSPSPAMHSKYSSQNSLSGQQHPSSRAGNPRSQYVGFTSQGIAVQRLSRGQHSVPSSHSHNNFQLEVLERRCPENLRYNVHFPSINIAERQARSSSLKSGAHHSVDPYAEFSDAHLQFNNHRSPVSYHNRNSSSSSENSPQASPHHAYRTSSHAPQHFLPGVHPQHQQTSYTSYPQQNGRRQASPSTSSDIIHHDLHEVQQFKKKQASANKNRYSSDVFDSPHRSSSRNTYAKSDSHVPRRVNSNDSFSFASSIKCCVGLQSSKKKKKSSRQIALYHTQQRQAQQKHREKENSLNAHSDNWVSLSAVRSQYSPQMLYRSSPSHSTVSCPYTASNTKHTKQQQHKQQHKHSSGYASEIETSSWSTPMGGGYSSNYESDSDFSDSDFARARGKSANSVMMKLAKKFSKKNLPITRDDEDDGSIGEDSLGRGEAKSWKLKQRSNSVSNLDSVDG